MVQERSAPMGAAQPAPELLSEIASELLDRRSRVVSWGAEPVPYAWGSPATAGLWRVSGTADDGARWGAFVKQIQHPRHWPMLHVVPEALRPDFLANFPWRAELEAWQPGFSEHLPPGLRLPRLLRLADLGDDRLAIWMEDVQTSPAPWDRERFERAAQALGGLAARRSDASALERCGVPVGYGLRMYVKSRVSSGWLALEDDAFWAHPLVAASCDDALRRDLGELHRRLPAVLDRLEQLPQTVPHGDASPQNLLQPADEPDTLVAIDLSFQCPSPIGFDLGQLLVGLVHAGEMPAVGLAALDACLIRTYTQAARADGLLVTEDEVRYGHHGGLLARAGFTSLPVERLHEPVTAELREVFAQRAHLTRYIADVGLALP